MATDMTGKTVLITGANSGIGKAAAIGLAKLHAHVIMVCRDKGRGEAAQAEVKAASGSDKVDLLLADLSSLAEIRRLAAAIKARYPRLDVLLNNAGVINGRRATTVDGYESTFALNHLAYFLLTHELLDLLKASAPARIINVSSDGHTMYPLDLADLQADKGYDSLKVYCRSKLANIYFTYELARRLAGTGITTNTMHPGAVSTGFGTGNKTWFGFAVWIARPFLRTPEQGADTAIYLASAPELNGVTGKYFVNRKPKPSAKVSYDEAIAQKLWAISETLTGAVTAPGAAPAAG